MSVRPNHARAHLGIVTTFILITVNVYTFGFPFPCFDPVSQPFTTLEAYIDKDGNPVPGPVRKDVWESDTGTDSGALLANVLIGLCVVSWVKSLAGPKYLPQPDFEGIFDQRETPARTHNQIAHSTVAPNVPPDAPSQKDNRGNPMLMEPRAARLLFGFVTFWLLLIANLYWKGCPFPCASEVEVPSFTVETKEEGIIQVPPAGTTTTQLHPWALVLNVLLGMLAIRAVMAVAGARDSSRRYRDLLKELSDSAPETPVPVPSSQHVTTAPIAHASGYFHKPTDA